MEINIVDEQKYNRPNIILWYKYTCTQYVNIEGEKNEIREMRLLGRSFCCFKKRALEGTFTVMGNRQSPYKIQSTVYFIHGLNIF